MKKINLDESSGPVNPEYAHLFQSMEDLVQEGPGPNLIEKYHILRRRIAGTVRVLAYHIPLTETGMTRADYVRQLKNDIWTCYGYNDFYCGKLIEMFPSMDLCTVLEAFEYGRPDIVRANTLKISHQSLHDRLLDTGAKLNPFTFWSKFEGIMVDVSAMPFSLGDIPEYQNGLYSLETFTHFLPVIALDPMEDEKILDMVASFGYATTHIAALMNNTGLLLANETDEERIGSLKKNIIRQGVQNTSIITRDGTELPGILGENSQDKVLLHAPSTRTGLTSEDESIKESTTYSELVNCTQRQMELILAAIDLVNADSQTGGYVVYATSSILVEENELVVDYALANRDVEVIESGMGSGSPGFSRLSKYQFHPSVEKTKRYYPHITNMDGTFVAKLKKISDAKPPEEMCQAECSSQRERDRESARERT